MSTPVDLARARLALAALDEAARASPELTLATGQARLAMALDADGKERHLGDDGDQAAESNGRGRGREQTARGAGVAQGLREARKAGGALAGEHDRESRPPPRP